MKRRIRLVAILCLIALTCSLVFSSCSEENTPEETKKEGEPLENIEADPTEAIAMKIDDIVVTKSMMSYFFRSDYAKYIGIYAQYAGLLGSETPYACAGIDPDKSLKNQQCSLGVTTNGANGQISGLDKSSWYVYLLEQTKETVSQYLVYAAAAKEEGIVLGTDEKKIIDTEVEETILTIRDSLNLSKDTSDDLCCRKAFGAGVQKQDVWDAIALKTLATKMADTKEKEINTAIKNDDDKINAKYNQNPNLFHYADYLYFSFEVDYEDIAEELYPNVSALSDIQEENVKAVYKERIEKARKNAEELATKKTAEEYKAFISDFTDDPEYALCEYVEYSEDSEDVIESWVFNADRQQFDSKVFEYGDGAKGNTEDIYHYVFCAEIVLLIKPSYKMETLSRDFAYLLFSDENSAKTAINAVKSLDNLTKESFLKLAENENNPAVNHGFLEDCAIFDMQDYDFDEWLFDQDLTEGSYTTTPLALSGNSYMVALYVKQNSIPEWKHRVIETLSSENFTDFENSITSKFKTKIQLSDDVLSKLEDSATTYIDKSGTPLLMTPSGAIISNNSSLLN